MVCCGSRRVLFGSLDSSVCTWLADTLRFSLHFLLVRVPVGCEGMSVRVCFLQNWSNSVLYCGPPFDGIVWGHPSRLNQFFSWLVIAVVLVFVRSMLAMDPDYLATNTRWSSLSRDTDLCPRSASVLFLRLVLALVGFLVVLALAPGMVCTCLSCPWCRPSYLASSKVGLPFLWSAGSRHVIHVTITKWVFWLFGITILPAFSSINPLSAMLRSFHIFLYGSVAPFFGSVRGLYVHLERFILLVIVSDQCLHCCCYCEVMYCCAHFSSSSTAWNVGARHRASAILFCFSFVHCIVKL